jgi:hypothetical protein
MDGFAPTAGETFDLINAAGGANLSAATLQIEGLEPDFDYSEMFTNGEFTLTAINDGVSVSSAPEPNSFWLFAAALTSVLPAGAARKALVRRRPSES